MQFSRQEYWSRLLFPPPADLPNSEMEPASPMFPALAGGFLTHWAIAEAPYSLSTKIFLDISTSHRDSLNFMPHYLPCNLYPIFHKLLLVFESFQELFLYFVNSLKALVHQASLRELTGVNIWLRNFTIQWKWITVRLSDSWLKIRVSNFEAEIRLCLLYFNLILFHWTALPF